MVNVKGEYESPAYTEATAGVHAESHGFSGGEHNGRESLLERGDDICECVETKVSSVRSDIPNSVREAGP